MKLNFEDNKDFLDLIRRKESQIIERTTDEIQESKGFKIVFSGLKSMIRENFFGGEKIVQIKEENILKVGLDTINSFNSLFADSDFALKNLITLDDELNIISKEKVDLPNNSGEARKCYSKISEEGFVVFLLLKNEIAYFIKGSDKSKSPFFSLADVNKYHERKDFSQIKDVLQQYQEKLKDRATYCKFFIEKSHLKSLHKDFKSKAEEGKFIEDYKHLLRNKPEDTFRDDLRHYLSSNLKVSQVKELLLESMKRLDIYLYDNYGEEYFIEVKWVGQSIHQDGKKTGTEYTAKDINPNAFYQTLDYIEELIAKKHNLVRGYLIVFDARKENMEDTGEGFDDGHLSGNQKTHYRRFEKTKDLRVRNIHPS